MTFIHIIIYDNSPSTLGTHKFTTQQSEDYKWDIMSLCVMNNTQQSTRAQFSQLPVYLEKVLCSSTFSSQTKRRYPLSDVTNQ